MFLVKKDPGLLSISELRGFFRRNLTAFRCEVLRKKALFCVLAVLLNQFILWYLPKCNFLFDRSRNLRCAKYRTLVDADPGPPANSKNGAICNNSLRYEAVY